MKRKHLLAGVYTFGLAVLLMACNDRSGDTTNTGTGTDTNRVDTRRNGTDTTNYLSNDPKFNDASPKTTTTQ